MSPQITPQALKMAWKMVRTIFDQFQVSGPDRDALLHLISLLSLQDLLGEKSAAWSGGPVPASVLSFKGGKVRLTSTPHHPLPLRKILTSRQIEEAYDRSEAILDRLEIPEVERASLFTALPCLGLQALQQSGLLEWRNPPPFPELG
ncbi:MAG: hypothetical protein V3T83_03575 [Acidobacteriota bacterium]